MVTIKTVVRGYLTGGGWCYFGVVISCFYFCFFRTILVGSFLHS